MKQGAIVVKDLGKVYHSRDGGRPTTLKGFLLSGYKAQKRESFWGLRGINFSVSAGRAVGVVGLNGAGKSTLLRLIGGVGRAEEGTISVHGRVGALLDIGVGLTEELSGRENIYVLGVIAGMLRSEIAQRFDEIVEFAELNDYIDTPVRTYSSGMKMRLAFSVAIHTSPEVLLIDEVLAVGDKAFQLKCFERVASIREAGCTLFLVSHDLSQIRALCDDVLLLERGRMIAYGPIEETLARYHAAIEAKSGAVHQVPSLRKDLKDKRLEQGVNRFGSGEVQIDSVKLIGRSGRPVDEMKCGDPISIEFNYRGRTESEGIIALVGIYSDDETCCFESNTDGLALKFMMPLGRVALEVARLDLRPGRYRVSVGLYSLGWDQCYDYHAEVYPLRVMGDAPSKGLLNPPAAWQACSHLAPFPEAG